MAVTILPGIDESIGPRIKALGQAIYERTGLARRRMIEEAVLKNPKVAQEFADLEYKSPGTLEKLGLKDVGEMLASIRPSRDLEIDVATREEAVPTAIAEAKSGRGIAELKSEIINEYKNAATPEQREQAFYKLSQIPTVGETKEEQAKASELTGFQANYIARGIADQGDEFINQLPPQALQIYKANKDFIDNRVKALLEDKKDEEQNRVEVASNLLGQAISFGESLGDELNPRSSQQIVAMLAQANPDVAADPKTAGLLTTAANTALKEINARGPRTAEERRFMDFYMRAEPANRIITELSKKGMGWNTKMDLANSLMRVAAGADIGLGVGGISSDRQGKGVSQGVSQTESVTKDGRRVLTKTGKAAIIGVIDDAVAQLQKTTMETTSGGIGARLARGAAASTNASSLIAKLLSVRANLQAGGDMYSEDIPTTLFADAARATMNADEYRFFNAAARFVEAQLRGVTGFKIDRGEHRSYITQFIDRQGEESPESSLDKLNARDLAVDNMRKVGKLKIGYYDEQLNEVTRRREQLENRGDRQPPGTTRINPPEPDIKDLLTGSSIPGDSVTAGDTVQTLMRDSQGNTQTAFQSFTAKAKSLPGTVVSKSLNMFKSLFTVDNTIDSIKDNENIPNRQQYVDNLNKRKDQIVRDGTNGRIRNPEVEMQVQGILKAAYPLGTDSARLVMLRNLRRVGAPDLVLKEVMKELKLDPKQLDEEY